MVGGTGSLTTVRWTWANGSSLRRFTAFLHPSNTSRQPVPGNHEGTCRKEGRCWTRYFPGVTPAASNACRAASAIVTYSSFSSLMEIPYTTLKVVAMKVLRSQGWIWALRHMSCFTHRRRWSSKCAGLLSSLFNKLWAPPRCSEWYWTRPS